jgi:CO dehydrogenase maturation factor
MKIVVCGKGGSGKSTIATLLAKSMANSGYKVLVIDSDESNYGLHRQLGMKLPEDFINYFGGKKAMIERMLENLVLTENELVIVDTDAGIEHFGRSVEQGCDIILAVIDPSFESLMLSNKIYLLADSINKPVYFVLNKVDDESKQVMLAAVDSGNKIAGIIPVNNDVFRACLAGEELDLQLAEIDELAMFIRAGKTEK